MPPTGPWTLKNGKDSWRRARELKPNSHVRFTPGDTLEGNGIDLRSILQRKDVGFADSHEARSIFSPQDYGFEQDPNIIWIQNPTRTFKDEQGAQFSQLQSIIRDRLRNLNYDYAVVRAGPHCTQNQYNELGTVLKYTNGWTGR
ncbi:uncharacterized protein B0T23DRAFT_313028 [Neurospora hispaniola]|uniref:Uncharacterized protein n=1 Tax=Neurospora hispaniola TaxID=588809 RepID=A0AAJ0MSC8_9PEZI|nr:hypothetical protein B0T23DRAFT_313028 [Neurospora hispaniola]